MNRAIRLFALLILCAFIYKQQFPDHCDHVWIHETVIRDKVVANGDRLSTVLTDCATCHEGWYKFVQEFGNPIVIKPGETKNLKFELKSEDYL